MSFALNFKASDQLVLIPAPPNLTARQVDDYVSVIAQERFLWTTEGLVTYKSRQDQVVLALMHAVAFYKAVSHATRP